MEHHLEDAVKPFPTGGWGENGKWDKPCHSCASPSGLFMNGTDRVIEPGYLLILWQKMVYTIGKSLCILTKNLGNKNIEWFSKHKIPRGKI